MILPRLAPHFTLGILIIGIMGCERSSKQAVKTDNLGDTKILQINSIQTTKTPLYYSGDGGTTWNPLNSDLPGEIQASFLAGFSNEIILATDNLGLYISEANHTKWKSIGDGFFDKKINALQVFENEIYVGVYKQGIFISPDRGETWNSINQNLKDLKIQSILKHKDFLLAGTDSGIQKYDFEKNNWKTVLNGEQIVSLNVDEGKIIAGTTAGVFISLDQGSSWNPIHQKGALHNTAILNGLIVAMYISGDLFISEDWGTNWIKSNYYPSASSYVYEVAYVQGHFILSNNYGIHESKDGGRNWTHIYKREDLGFFDFLVMDNVIYGGTRDWNEWREKTGFFKF